MDCPEFLNAFQKALNLTPGSDIIAHECYQIGNLVLTSGTILACDPGYCADAKPFVARPVPSGQYPVILYVAQLQNNDQRIVLAALQISETLPVKWAMALPPDHEDTTFYYCVDSGIGCFMDADTAQSLANMLVLDEEASFLADEMSNNHSPHGTWSWANVPLNSETGANLIAFSSGWGDGSYASYFGYDADGNIVCLVTDFGLLEEENASA